MPLLGPCGSWTAPTAPLLLRDQAIHGTWAIYWKQFHTWARSMYLIWGWAFTAFVHYHFQFRAPFCVPMLCIIHDQVKIRQHDSFLAIRHKWLLHLTTTCLIQGAILSTCEFPSVSASVPLIQSLTSGRQGRSWLGGFITVLGSQCTVEFSSWAVLSFFFNLIFSRSEEQIEQCPTALCGYANTGQRPRVHGRPVFPLDGPKIMGLA